MHIGVFRGCKNDTQRKHQNTACRAHQIDDGVCLGAQGLYGDVGHECHGGGAEGCHGEQHHEQRDDKADEGKGIGNRQINGQLPYRFGEDLVGHCPLTDLGDPFCRDAGELEVVDQRQANEGDHGDHRSDQDKRRALAELGIDLVGECPKEREKEYRQYVIDRHNSA